MTFKKIRIAFYLAIILSASFVYFMPISLKPFPFAGQQVWKHRQNTSEAAISSFNQGYTGVEADLTYLDGVLKLAHDPSEYDDAITLTDYVKQIETKVDRAAYWFDVKNLNFSNKEKIRTQLLALGMSDRIIVESSSPLYMFDLCSNGIKCTVWAKGAHSWINRLWYRLNINLLSKFADIVSVSFDHRNYEISDSVVPKDASKLLFTFAPKADLSSYADKQDVRILLKD